MGGLLAWLIVTSVLAWFVGQFVGMGGLLARHTVMLMKSMELFFSLCCHLAYPANLCSHDAHGYWLEFHFGLTSPTLVDPQVIWLKVEFQTTMGGFMGHHSRSE